MHCATRRRPPPPSRPPTRSPPALEHCRRFAQAVAARAAAREPSPANRRDRRPARNIQPGRNARIAQLDVGRRHRRGARPGHRRRSNTATGFPMPSPRGPPPANRRDRRPARNPSQGAMHALRGSTSAAATVAAPALATASARTPPPVRARPRRAGCRPRSVTTAGPRGTPSQGAMRALRSSTSAAATVAAPALATAGARTPPPIVPHRRRAGRRPRTVATVAPSERPARAQCTHCADRRRPPPPSRRPPWPPPALEHHHRFSRAVAAMGRPATSGARRPIAEHLARCAARAAHDHRRRPPPSRPPTSAPPRLPQRSRSLLRPRTVAPSIKSAHRGRFPTYPPVPALHPFSTTNTVVGNGARPTLLRCRSIAASVRTRGYVENLRGITTARAPNFQPDMHCLRSTTSLPICRTEDGSTCAFIFCFFSLCFPLCDAGKTSLCFNQANASAATKSHFGWLR